MQHECDTGSFSKVSCWWRFHGSCPTPSRFTLGYNQLYNPFSGQLLRHEVDLMESWLIWRSLKPSARPRSHSLHLFTPFVSNAERRRRPRMIFYIFESWVRSGQALFVLASILWRSGDNCIFFYFWTVCLKLLPGGSCLANNEHVIDVSQSSCLSVGCLKPTSFYSRQFVVGDLSFTLC